MSFKRFVLPLILCLLVFVPAILAGQQHDILIRVPFETKQDWIQLRQMGLDIVLRGDDYFEIVASQSELDALEGQGFKYEVIHESMGAFYRSRLDVSKDMGGYMTLDEIIAHVDTVIADHPNIVSAKQNLGSTIEGRDMWAIKISDNPEIDEDEPEVMFTAAIHAREVITPLVLLNFVDYITDNYSLNPDVKNLVDEREIWIVPVVNPDGYYYNEYTDPSGGGMWRKNRRNNGDGSYGVDLNRNYGYEWGYNNSGSSSSGSSEIYRGSGPFSEPEAQNMRDFALAHEFIVTLYFHSYSNAILWPWGYDSYYTPDQDLFVLMGDSISSYNGYDPTIIWGFDEVNGVTDDWYYGEQTLKNKSYSFSIEVGNYSDGFWPSTSRIPDLVDENLQPQLFLTRIAGHVEQMRAPTAPAITLDSIINGSSYTVAWTHDDSLNPAVVYELLEMQNPQRITDSCNSFDNWDNDGYSVSTTRSYSAPSSFYSGSGNNLNNSVAMGNGLMVEAGDTLRFKTWYDIESNWDYAYVEVATDGVNFSSIPGNLTTTSNPNGTNQGNGITGASSGWVDGVFDLTAYVGQQIQIRFRYNSDGAVVNEGFYIDDIAPHFAYGSETVISSTIADDYYAFSGKEAGLYTYKVRAKDAEDQWGPFSDPATTEVLGANNGDMDVDGISHAISDLVVYNNYFMNGLSAFTYDVETQIGQSDINCDGLTLAESDRTYLEQVILGLAEPCTPPEKTGLSLLVPSGPAAPRDNPAYSVTVANTEFHAVDTGWVTIDMNTGNENFVGFQLHLEYDTTGLELLDVQRGEDLTAWNYFDYSVDIVDDMAQLRISAVAATGTGEIIEDDISPLPSPKTLVRMKFGLTDPGEPISRDINFVWDYCGDNTIAVGTLPGPTVQVLAVSDNVYNADLADITGISGTYGGAAESCTSGWLGTAPSRGIDYTSGRVSFEPSCCIGTVGNVDCGEEELPDMGDLTVLIDHLFISLSPLCCEPEANVDLTGIVDMGDLTVLIDHLFISLNPLPPCP